MTDTSTSRAVEKRLIIDLSKCDQCDSCGVRCDYYDRRHEHEHGMLMLREKATFTLVCRRCSFASCIEACMFNALERLEDGVIVRHNMRCVSCKMCAHACPFGTIYADMLPFYESQCDACLADGGKEPVCVATCSKGALEYRVVGDGEADLHVVDAFLAARTRSWVRKEAIP